MMTPRRKQRTDADILRAAQKGCGCTSQLLFARHVLGVSLSGYTGWLGGATVPPPVVRLCSVLEKHPELCDEIIETFKEREA
jgi:hypothetical protein